MPSVLREHLSNCLEVLIDFNAVTVDDLEQTLNIRWGSSSGSGPLGDSLGPIASRRNSAAILNQLMQRAPNEKYETEGYQSGEGMTLTLKPKYSSPAQPKSPSTGNRA